MPVVPELAYYTLCPTRMRSGTLKTHYDGSPAFWVAKFPLCSFFGGRVDGKWVIDMRSLVE